MAVKMTPADKRWSKALKERDGYACRRCTTAYGPGHRGLHTHHIFTRSREPTRCELLNGVTLCYGCHRYVHANPLEFHEWIRVQLGEAEYEALRKRSIGGKVAASKVSL